MKSDPKFEEKLTCGLENDMRNLANFYQSTWKSPNWEFDGILLSKVENEEWCKIWRVIDTSFQNWLYNLTNFDPSTQMSQKFAL